MVEVYKIPKSMSLINLGQRFFESLGPIFVTEEFMEALDGNSSERGVEGMLSVWRRR